jgi:hypothetical protein
MVKHISKIALALLVSGPLLAGCAKSPFATDSSSSTSASMDGADGRGFASAAGGAAGGPAGAYGQGNAARPNPKEFSQSAQLKDIRFEFDRYDIRAEDAEVLDANAESLKANPKLLILIEGHTDQRGTSEYNLALAREGVDELSRLARRPLEPDRGRQLRQGTPDVQGRERGVLESESPRALHGQGTVALRLYRGGGATLLLLAQTFSFRIRIAARHPRERHALSGGADYRFCTTTVLNRLGATFV